MFSIKDASLNFIFVALGGIFIGILLGYLIVKLRLFLRVHGLEEIPMSIVIELITPFAIYMAAEEFHVSESWQWLLQVSFMASSGIAFRVPRLNCKCIN
ncbi:hypothetical protein KEH51_07935 [[Brevibacterium] frigoritolerans]|uniref:Cation/H+ exchanger domain-containing protein n=1 Tax=Peribacillus frigoritolerans TaxID=450367 RepID=A0A941FQ96_9BACI|nr:hypothetical protein [Peribacillus frigoritolerans]